MSYLATRHHSVQLITGSLLQGTKHTPACMCSFLHFFSSDTFTLPSYSNTFSCWTNCFYKPCWTCMQYTFTALPTWNYVPQFLLKFNIQFYLQPPLLILSSIHNQSWMAVKDFWPSYRPLAGQNSSWYQAVQRVNQISGFRAMLFMP